MRLLTVTRYTENKREYFTLRLSQPAVAPAITISWSNEGKDYSNRLVVTSTTGNTVTGYLSGVVDGDLLLTGTIGSIAIEDEGTTYVSPKLEKKQEAKDSTELLTFNYPEAITVNHAFPIASQPSGFHSGIYPFINRVADAGASGLNLIKKVATGWTLPGILTPEIIDQERLDTLLTEEYNLESVSLNRCYIFKDELLFIQKSPGGSSLLRKNLTDVYSFEVDNTIQTNVNSRRLLEQALDGKLGVLRKNASLWDWRSIKTPSVGHFSYELDDIYDEIRTLETTEVASELRAFIPPKTQDRLATDSYSLPRRNHNTIRS